MPPPPPLRSVIRALGLALALAAAAGALLPPREARSDEAIPDAPRPPRVGKITLEGATGVIPASELAAKVGIVVPGPLEIDRVRAAIRELYATGAFRSVEATTRPLPGTDEVELVFRVFDRLLLAEIVVTGDKALPKADVERSARLSVDSEIDVPLADRAAERVRDRYVVRGFHDVKVKASLAPTVDPTRVRLVLEVEEGEPIRIERIVFSGRPVVGPVTLTRALPKDLRLGKTLDVSLFRSAREAVRTYLRRLRYFDAVVKEPTYEIDRARHTAVLTFPVVAGPLYQLDFIGNEVLTDTALRLLLEEEDRPGFVAPLRSDEKDPGLITEALQEELAEKMIRRYQEIGFLLAAVEVKVELREGTLPVASDAPEAPATAGSRRVPLAATDPLHLTGGETATWDGVGALGAGLTTRGPIKILRFVVTERKPVKLLKDALGILFVGNDHIDGDELRDRLMAVVRAKLEAAETADWRSKPLDDLEVSGREAIYAPVRPGLSPLLPKEVYVPELFDEAIQSLVNLYRSEGYWDVEIDPPAIAVNEEAGFVSLTITIHEGDRQLLREVLFDGSVSVDARTLLLATKLELDDPLDPLALEAARTRILELYNENGFLFPEVDYEVARLDPTTSIAVFKVAEGPRSLVESIEVRGLASTARAVVTARLDFEIGEWVKPSDLRASERALLALGIFTAVSVAPEDPEVPGKTKKIIVTVAEDKFWSVEGKLGYSTDDGPRGRFALSYSNLFGRGWNASGLIHVNYPLFGAVPILFGTPRDWPDHPWVCAPPDRSFAWPGADDRRPRGCIPARLEGYDAIERRLVLGLRIPQLLKLVVPFDVSGELIHSRKTELAYGLTEFGGRITMASSLRGEFNLSLQTDVFSDTYVTYSDEALGELPRNLVPQLFPDARITLLSVRPVFSWDLRDNPFNATKGLLATIKLDYVVSLYDGRSPEDGVIRPPIKVHAVRADVVVNGYVPLPWPRKAVLALSWAFGTAIPIFRGEAIPPDRAFFMGGRNTMRGYFEQEMLPQDIVYSYVPCEPLLDPSCDPTEEVRGLRTPARLYILHRAELRFPLFRSGFDLGIFVDSGNSWANLASIYSIPFSVQVNPGVALRYPTPVGPISVEIGFNGTARAKVLERAVAFHFSLGVF